MQPHYHEPMIYTMMLVSGADSEVTDAEKSTIGRVVYSWPSFRDYDRHQLGETIRHCRDRLKQDHGLDEAVRHIAEELPAELYQTAYAAACEVAAADGESSFNELTVLRTLQRHLGIPDLAAAAIQHGTAVRHATAD